MELNVITALFICLLTGLLGVNLWLIKAVYGLCSATAKLNQQMGFAISIDKKHESEMKDIKCTIEKKNDVLTNKIEDLTTQFHMCQLKKGR